MDQRGLHRLPLTAITNCSKVAAGLRASRRHGHPALIKSADKLGSTAFCWAETSLWACRRGKAPVSRSLRTAAQTNDVSNVHTCTVLLLLISCTIATPQVQGHMAASRTPLSHLSECVREVVRRQQQPRVLLVVAQLLLSVCRRLPTPLLQLYAAEGMRQRVNDFLKIGTAQRLCERLTAASLPGDDKPSRCLYPS